MMLYTVRKELDSLLLLSAWFDNWRQLRSGSQNFLNLVFSKDVVFFQVVRHNGIVWSFPYLFVCFSFHSKCFRLFKELLWTIRHGVRMTALFLNHVLNFRRSTEVVQLSFCLPVECVSTTTTLTLNSRIFCRYWIAAVEKNERTYLFEISSKRFFKFYSRRCRAKFRWVVFSSWFITFYYDEREICWHGCIYVFIC